MAGWRGTKGEKLRVVLLLAERATGLDSFLRRAREKGKSYEIVGALTTTPNSQAPPILERWGIPWRCHDIHDFYRCRGAEVRDMSLRPDFDRKSLELIADFRPSLLSLYGYIYILSGVVLEAYPFRIINIHDSDLTISDGEGRHRYRGLHGVREAILAGETFTYSTVHIVTEEVDGGPILIRSHPYPVHVELVRRAREWGALDILKAYAYAQREWMMRDSWGLLLDTSLELLGQGRVSIRGGRVFIDGRPGPWEVDLRESRGLHIMGGR